MDPKATHRMDQAGADVRDSVAPALFQMYDAYKQSGFDDGMAFELTKTFLVWSLNSNSGPNKNGDQFKRLTGIVEQLAWRLHDLAHEQWDERSDDAFKVTYDELTKLKGELG